MKKVLVLDFGGQYNLLVARRVRECGIYCEIKSYRMTMDEIRTFAPDALIFTGGPATVFEEGAPMVDPAIFELGVPVLGICYGLQLMIHLLGGECRRAETREYGKVELTHSGNSPLFDGVPEKAVYWMSHGVEVGALGPGFEVIGSTAGCAHAAVQCEEKKLYGVQFHPEVLHTVYGTDILKNFLYKICGFAPEWTMASYLEEAVEDCRRRIGSGKVLLALSGGVDSSVAAALLQRAVGDQLTCIFVDHGLLRKDEGDMVERVMTQQFHVNVRRVNAGARFLGKLAGVTEPEKKRKIIGEEFIRVFEDEAKKIGAVDFLFKEIIEPLRRLFKDEVRQLGMELGLPEELVWRQPFPGPGLAIRIIGDITQEKVAIVQDADAIWREEVDKLPAAQRPSQYFAALTNMRSVGVMGDERTYDYAIALRAVTTTDFMTAEVTLLPTETITTAANRIVNEVKHINRVLFDYTTKPPATIEWE